MTVELTTEELTLLNAILVEHYRELLQEIFHTDNREFKARLRAKERRLDALMRKLELQEKAAA